MKNFFNKIKKAVTRLFRPLAIAAVGGACALALTASAQVSTLNLTTATNLPAVITAAAGSNTLTSWIQVRQNSGVAIDWSLKTGTGTSNVAIQVQPSVDGTNLIANISWWIVASANGTTTTHVGTNLNKDMLAGYNYINISALTNQNSTTVTNNGLKVSKWPAPLAY